MADSYLKLIQNGMISFIPDNKRNRSFWAKQNTLVGRSKSAHSEIITILPATPEEVQHMQHTDVAVTTKIAGIVSVPAQDNSAIFEMFNSLRKKNEELEERIENLSGVRDEKVPGDEVNTDPERQRGKPGPKPKQ